MYIGGAKALMAGNGLPSTPGIMYMAKARLAKPSVILKTVGLFFLP
ncbi:MAG: hypothetical protein ACI4TR_00365 [Bacteroidaceae bacterium]